MTTRPIYGNSRPSDVRRDTDTDKSITQIQTLLGVTPISGFFGDKTKAAVQAFQRSKGITPDGRVGQQTWNLMFPESTGQSTAAPAGQRTRSEVAEGAANAITNTYKIIIGKVFTIQNNERKYLPNVEIQIKNSNPLKTTRTDKNGGFRLTTGPGNGILFIRAMGAHPHEVPFSTSGERTVIIPDVELKPITMPRNYEQEREAQERRENIDRESVTPEFTQTKQSVEGLNKSIREILGDTLETLTNDTDKKEINDLMPFLNSDLQTFPGALDNISDVKERIEKIIEMLTRLGGENPANKRKYDRIITRLREKTTRLQNIYTQNQTRVSGAPSATASTTATAIEGASATTPPATSAPTPANNITIADLIDRAAREYPEYDNVANRTLLSFGLRTAGVQRATQIGSQTVSENGRQTSITVPDLIQRIRSIPLGGEEFAPIAQNLLREWGVGEQAQPATPVAQPSATTAPNITPSSSPQTIPTPAAGQPTTIAPTSPPVGTTPLEVASREAAGNRITLGSQATRPPSPMIAQPKTLIIPQQGPPPVMGQGGGNRTNIPFPVRHPSNSYERNMLMNLGRAFGYQ